MLPEDAFLRRLPMCLDPAQSVQVEALVFSSDAIDANLDIIKRETLKYREAICDAPYPVRVGLFTSAWAIVDCVHVARQVIRALDYLTPVASDFLSKYESAAKLRNKMDHLTSNASNIANAKGRPPVFGTLSYVCIPERNVRTTETGAFAFDGGGTVLLSTGRFAAGGVITFVNPADVQPMTGRVSSFLLSAFDHSINLNEVADNLRNVMVEINANLETTIREQVAKTAAENEIPVEKLMENDAGGLAIFLAFKASQLQTDK
jgi:hypothetical protein